MTVAADIDAAVEFLQWWRPAGPWLLTAIPNDRRQITTCAFAEVAPMRKWLEAQSKNNWNTYFSVNPTTAGLSKKAEARDITALEWLHVDIDPEKGADINEERKRILAAIQDKDNGLPAPSCITYSGGGYWAFWRLEEPVPIKDPEDAKLYNLQLELELGADGCHNIDRIARLPGTVNWPDAKKVAKGQMPAVALVLEQNDNVYPLAKFQKAVQRQDSITDASGGTAATQVTVSGNVQRVTDLDDLPDAMNSRAKVVIAQGKDHDEPLAGKDQSRSAWLMYACCALVRAKVDDETIYAIITDPTWAISASVLDKGNSAQIRRYAIRQIKRAKETAINPALSSLNDKYALVESLGGRCRVAREGWNHSLDQHEVEFLLIDGFKATHNNKRVDMGFDDQGNPRPPAKMGIWWLEHPERRTYQDVIFYPGKEFDGSLNLWRGFAYDAIPGECSLYLDHLRNILCQGNQEWFDYLLGWMAYAVQFPHQPGHVAVVMRGRQGTGKGTFAQHFGNLWGVHFKHVTKAEMVTGQFNNMLKDASVVFADECFRTGKAHVAALKTLVTETTMRVEAKGIDNLETRNCTKIIMSTNESWAVHADMDDRRFFILETSNNHRKDTAYFGAMEEQMENGGYQALLHMLLAKDLTGFNVRNAPQTSELKKQQRMSMRPEEAMLFTALEDGRLIPAHGHWEGEVIADQLVDHFASKFCLERISEQGARTRIGILCTRIFGRSGYRKERRRGPEISWRDSRGQDVVTKNPWMCVFPTLEDCRAAWDAEFGPQDWPEDDGDDPAVDPSGAF